MKDVIEHYDKLIEENNDSSRDPEPLKNYMDKWDGMQFIECMHLDKRKSVLEIGVGTGRIALKVAPLCKQFVGIDLSPKTISRASENLSSNHNVKLICNDFMTYVFENRFDVIYSSLTFMRIEDKASAIQKISSLLNDGGHFVLSIDKNQTNFIDMGTRKIKVYPDNPVDICKFLSEANLTLIEQFETELAHITVSIKKAFSCGRRGTAAGFPETNAMSFGGSRVSGG